MLVFNESASSLLILLTTSKLCSDGSCVPLSVYSHPLPSLANLNSLKSMQYLLSTLTIRDPPTLSIFANQVRSILPKVYCCPPPKACFHCGLTRRPCSPEADSMLSLLGFLNGIGGASPADGSVDTLYSYKDHSAKLQGVHWKMPYLLS
jgi:hypothetical protein